MAFRLGNNAQEMASNQPASAATAFNLAGAETGRQTILAAIGDDNSATFIAQEVDANGNPAGAWQIFVGTLNDATPDTLAQTTIISSSNAGSAVDWSALSAPLITLVAEESRLPRRTQYQVLAAGTASYDIALRANCRTLVMFENLEPSNDGIDMLSRVSTDGSTFDTGASAYSWQTVYSGGGSPSGTGDQDDSAMRWWSATGLHGNAGGVENITGHIWINGAGNSAALTRVTVEFRAATTAGTPEYIVVMGGSRLTAQADVALRIAPSAGTFDAGTIAVWEFPLT